MRLVLFLGCFLALAAGGIAWILHRSGTSWEDLGKLAALPPGVLVLLAVLSVAIYAADMVRYRMVGHALGTHISWRAGLEAVVANFFFSWISPAATLAAPAVIVVLARRGVSWDAAVLIAFGKSMIGSALLLVTAFVLLLVGAGPPLDPRVGLLLLPGAGMVAGFLLVLVLGALFPRPVLQRIDALASGARRLRPLSGPRAGRFIEGLAGVLTRAVGRLGQLRAGGWRSVVTILASQVAYFASFISVGVVLAWALGASSVPRAAGICTVYVAFLYTAPTPGATGLAEVMAVAFFGSILPAKEAVMLMLMFRALTIYLQVLLGIPYLLVAGGLGEILHARNRER